MPGPGAIQTKQPTANQINISSQKQGASAAKKSTTEQNPTTNVDKTGSSSIPAPDTVPKPPVTNPMPPSPAAAAGSRSSTPGRVQVWSMVIQLAQEQKLQLVPLRSFTGSPNLLAKFKLVSTEEQSDRFFHKLDDNLREKFDVGFPIAASELPSGNWSYDVWKP